MVAMTSANSGEPSKEQFHRIVYSIWDFHQALSALTFLIEDCDLEGRYSKVELRRFRCYETQAIISFCRPFVASRAGAQLSCKKVGVSLTPAEKKLKDQMVHLRNKIVAHSDSEEMHYKGVTIDLDECDAVRAPWFIFDEGLHLGESQRSDLESLLRKLMQGLYHFAFELYKSDPERFEVYKLPVSMQDQQP